MCDVKIMMSGVDGEYGIPPAVKMGCFHCRQLRCGCTLPGLWCPGVNMLFNEIFKKRLNVTAGS